MKYYSISQMATLTQLTGHTLRYYEKEGLLQVDRKANGIRIYSDDNLETINIIHCMKDAGMSIAKIKEYFALCKDNKNDKDNLDARKKLFEQQKGIVTEKINLLNKHLTTIEYKIWFYENLEIYGNLNDPMNCSKMRDKYDEVMPKRTSIVLNTKQCEALQEILGQKLSQTQLQNLQKLFAST